MLIRTPILLSLLRRMVTQEGQLALGPPTEIPKLPTGYDSVHAKAGKDLNYDEVWSRDTHSHTHSLTHTLTLPLSLSLSPPLSLGSGVRRQRCHRTHSLTHTHTLSLSLPLSR